MKSSLSLLKAKIKITYELELSIAKQNKKLEVHNKKWKELLSVVSVSVWTDSFFFLFLQLT